MYYCFLVFHHIGEYISRDLFYFVNLTSSCSLIPHYQPVHGWCDLTVAEVAAVAVYSDFFHEISNSNMLKILALCEVFFSSRVHL